MSLFFNFEILLYILDKNFPNRKFGKIGIIKWNEFFILAQFFINGNDNEIDFLKFHRFFRICIY